MSHFWSFLAYPLLFIITIVLFPCYYYHHIITVLLVAYEYHNAGISILSYLRF